jgi:hypothetical protein
MKIQTPKSRPKHKPTTPQTCAGCKFIWSVTEDPPNGFCRRNPPTLKVDGNSSAHIPVRLDWWCGEYRAAAKA